ncbi:hypothetical protein [Paenibacillus sp. UNC451MF]|uniref:hypothetical protein n=1 Tax=Paenibacillus sp. UNC451MF TaxID=1449063 RepID=UPI00048E8E65|nr:hypothetical protein [Paenibacillus sp. UNC451MF]
MASKSTYRQNKQQLDQISSAVTGQEETREQLSDVYAAGTSDGIVRLEEGTIDISDSKKK